MTNRIKKTVTLRRGGSKSNSAAKNPDESSPKFIPKQWRIEKQLIPIADRVEENIELMQRLRATIGSENRALARQAILDVTRYAQTLDPTISVPEGTTVTVILLKKIGHFKESIEE